MEQEKTKKSKFEKVFFIIPIILMIGVSVISSFETEKLDTAYAPHDIEDIIESQFNGKFEQYNGISKGIYIENLIKIINKNNIENDGTDIVISINGRTNENQYVFKDDSSINYKVEIEYYNNLVSNINIYKITNKTENNTISTNYSEFAEITGYKEEGTVGKVYSNIEENTNSNIINETISLVLRVLFEILKWLPIFIPFIIVNIIIYHKYKVLLKKSLYDYAEIRKTQILLVVLTSMIFCIISWFWLNYLEQATIYNYSIM